MHILDGGAGAAMSMRATSSSGNDEQDNRAGTTATAAAVSSILPSSVSSWMGPSGDTNASSSGVSQRATSVPNPAGSHQDGDQRNQQGIIANSNSSNSSSSSKLQSNSRHPPSQTTLSALLEPFNTSNDQNKDETTGRIKIPSTSRAGADIAEQKTVNQIGLLESWKYLPFLAHQASKLASAFVSHHVFGPPKKSWGIELTLFTTAIRESVQYSHLSSLNGLRRILNLGQILPVPKDGVVTPVNFLVKKRNLPGILKDADGMENGRRELSGEWVVSRRIWRRMQREHAVAQSQSQPHSSSTTPNAARKHNSTRRDSTTPPSSSSRPKESRRSSGTHSTPRSTKARSNSNSNPQSHPSQSSTSAGHNNNNNRDKVILYLHGGAYYVMSAATHRYITISVSKYTNCRVFAVNYRLAPECRWPGQIHDAVSAYLRLVEELNIPPEMIIFAGDSAGGGLALATIMYLRDHGFPLPCGAIVMSPWVDLTMSCDSWETNAPFDYLRMPSGDDHMNPIASLLGPSNVKNLITNPYVSPLFGDFTGFPPLLIQCGDAECLRDEGTLLAHKASLAGVQVYHEVYEDCPHVFQALFFLEASKKAFRSHRHFVKKVVAANPSSMMTRSASASSIRLPVAPNANVEDQDMQESGATHGDIDDASTSSFIRRNMVDFTTEMDNEVMSDAHAIKSDGQPERESLPASPRVSRRELSHAHSRTSSFARLGDALFQRTTPTTADSPPIPADMTEEEYEARERQIEAERQAGYDDDEDEEEEEEEDNPFENVESSGASVTSTSDADRETNDSQADEGDFGNNITTDDDPIQDDSANFALNATAAMIKAGTSISSMNHHDLDSVAEEQDEHIDRMEEDELREKRNNSRPSTASTLGTGFTFPGNAPSQRLQAHQHQHSYDPTPQHSQRRYTPVHSPSSSYTALPHYQSHTTSPSGSYTPLASRTPNSSAPPSPGTSLRHINQYQQHHTTRQRSLSSLSMAAMTLSTPNPGSISQSGSRPGHSRSSSSISVMTTRPPGALKEISKPRARANSHPHLLALLDSYDASGPAQHTVVWRNDSNEEVDQMTSKRENTAAGPKTSSEDGSMDDDTFDI